MAKHLFLSPGWIEAARAIRDAHTMEAHPPALSVRMNLVIGDVPFDASGLDAHLDTTGGELVIDLGHLAEADAVVSLDYPTAKSVLVDGDGQAAMQAFMTGRIRVEGDLAKLLAFQSAPPGPLQQQLAQELRAITA